MGRKPTSLAGPIPVTTIASTEITGLVSTTPILECVYVHKITLGVNANANVGWGYRLLDGEYKAGQWDDSEGASYTDDTTDAQDAGAGDFALFTTTNNDGFVVQADQKFNLVRIDTNTAPSGGSPAYEYTFWDGSAWTALTTISTPSYSADTSTVLLFQVPPTWARLAAADTPVATDGLTAGKFAIRIRATTAPSSAGGTAAKIVPIMLLDYIANVTAGAAAEGSYDNGIMVPHNHPIIPFYSVADAGNVVSIEFRPSI